MSNNSNQPLMEKIQHLCEKSSPPTPSGDVLIKPKKETLANPNSFNYLAGMILTAGGKWDPHSGQFTIPLKDISIGGQVKFRVKLSDLIPGAQPRLPQTQEQLDSLKADLKDNGQIQEIEVRKSPQFPTKYEVIDGHRRWHAAELIGWPDLDAKLVVKSDLQMNVDAFSINDQRGSFGDYERGRWYDRLMKLFPDAFPTQVAVANRFKKKRAEVSRDIKYFVQMYAIHGDKLPEKMIEESTSRSLRGIKDPVLQKKVMDAVQKENLNREETESLVKTVVAGEGATPLEDALHNIQEAHDDKTKAVEMKRKVLAKKASEYFPQTLVEDITVKFGKMSEEKLYSLLGTAAEFAWARVKETEKAIPQIMAKLDQLGVFKDNDLARESFNETLNELLAFDMNEIMTRIGQWKT